MKLNLKKMTYLGMAILSLSTVGDVSANAAQNSGKSEQTMNKSYITKHINKSLSKKNG